MLLICKHLPVSLNGIYYNKSIFVGALLVTLYCCCLCMIPYTQRERDIHFQSAAQTLQQIDEEGGRRALLFNYFTTLALRCAVLTLIPQIKVCGFYNPSPRLPHTHTHTLFKDGLHSLAAAM